MDLGLSNKRALVQASGGVDPFVVCHAARGFPV
jgi:hypothetical protein